MKTKEKAEELVRKNLIIVSSLEIIYGNNIDFEELKLDKNFKKAIECAKIAVDEIIENQPFRDYGFKYDSIDSRLNAVTNYWQGVKNELNKM